MNSNKEILDMIYKGPLEVDDYNKGIKKKKKLEEVKGIRDFYEKIPSMINKIIEYKNSKNRITTYYTPNCMGNLNKTKSDNSCSVWFNYNKKCIKPITYLLLDIVGNSYNEELQYFVIVRRYCKKTKDGNILNHFKSKKEKYFMRVIISLTEKSDVEKIKKKVINSLEQTKYTNYMLD